MSGIVLTQFYCLKYQKIIFYLVNQIDKYRKKRFDLNQLNL